ncbi:hypothetical protein HZ994_07960 [Akkermansiaceae bacterium]|nr:hypothetical protein HZ994_07960 [Akkermansiaceae bacterium]
MSKLLLRGYNAAKPIFDEGDGDDFWVALKGSSDRIRKIQVKSARLTKWDKRISMSVKIQMPQSILDGTVNVVVVALWDEQQSFIGLFDASDVRMLHDSGIGGSINRKKLTHTPHFGFRFKVDLSQASPRVTCGTESRDVTRHFNWRGGRWDELFPLERWANL